jgi:hypothetical protein
MKSFRIDIQFLSRKSKKSRKKENLATLKEPNVLKGGKKDFFSLKFEGLKIRI